MYVPDLQYLLDDPLHKNNSYKIKKTTIAHKEYMVHELQILHFYDIHELVSTFKNTSFERVYWLTLSNMKPTVNYMVFWNNDFKVYYPKNGIKITFMIFQFNI